MGDRVSGLTSTASAPAWDAAEGVTVYLGLDDTDVLHDGGTGALARSLARLVVTALPGSRLEGVSRHQLLRDPRVPCTRRNRCSCVVVRIERRRMDDLRRLGRAHVLERSVVGSDPGYCVLEEAQIGSEVIAFARLAKRELVEQRTALSLASAMGIHLEPLGGTGDGVIGALAAVGLRRGGDDGWLTLWGRIREIDGALSVGRLLEEGLDAVEDERGRPLSTDEAVQTGGRMRPALHRGRRVLVVRRSLESGAWHPVKTEARRE